MCIVHRGNQYRAQRKKRSRLNLIQKLRKTEEKKRRDSMNAETFWFYVKSRMRRASACFKRWIGFFLPSSLSLSPDIISQLIRHCVISRFSYMLSIILLTFFWHISLVCDIKRERELLLLNVRFTRCFFPRIERWRFLCMLIKKIEVSCICCRCCWSLFSAKFSLILFFSFEVKF
jgi:hypothetical protein